MSHDHQQDIPAWAQWVLLVPVIGLIVYAIGMYVHYPWLYLLEEVLG